MATVRLTRMAWKLGYLVVLVTALPFVAAAVTASSNALSVSIYFDPKESDSESPLWLGYLLARAKYVGDHENLYTPKVGEIAPSFGEEVEARTTAVSLYRELREKDRNLRVQYFDDLERVESNSFMREYVWTYLRQPTWDPPPNELKLGAFDAWKATNLKAYALTELKRVPEAQQALESAIELSPMNSQYLSELAYTYQVQKDCAKSIATYEQAASVAELSSEDATKTNDLTRAWRGQGYCLVEQGKLKEAEAKYHQALALDPTDRKSKGELEYIRRLNGH